MTFFRILPSECCPKLPSSILVSAAAAVADDIAGDVAAGDVAAGDVAAGNVAVDSIISNLDCCCRRFRPCFNYYYWFK